MSEGAPRAQGPTYGELAQWLVAQGLEPPSDETRREVMVSAVRVAKLAEDPAVAETYRQACSCLSRAASVASVVWDLMDQIEGGS